jgi:hypothetical protein
MITLNDLHFSIEIWDDPGDYPSGAGSGPLPSYNYPVVEGVAWFNTEPTENELDNLVPEAFSCKFDVIFHRSEMAEYPSIWEAVPIPETLVLQNTVSSVPSPAQLQQQDQQPMPHASPE